MAGDAENVRVWLGADVFVGPEGTTLPTTVDEELHANFEALGILATDGMVEGRSEQVTEHYGWGHGRLRTTKAQFAAWFRVTPLEDNDAVFRLLNPGSTVESAGGVTTRTKVVPLAEVNAYIVETRDGGVTRRKIVPRGEIVQPGDVTSNETTMSGFPITVNAYPFDTDEDGNSIYEIDITDDPGATPTGS